MPLPFEECPRSGSRLCWNERLTSALIFHPNGRGGRTRLDKRDGLPVVHFHKCTAPDVQTFHQSALNSYTTYSDATLLLNGWGDRNCMLVQGAARRKKDRELCITLWYSKMSKYNGSVFEVCNVWYIYVPMMIC